MTEVKISEEIIKVMDYLGEKIGVAVDWTSTDVLPLLQEICAKYISWEIATSIVWMIAGVLTGVIGVIVIKIIYNYLKKNQSKFYNEDIWLLCILSVIFGGIAISVIGIEVFDIVKCKCFPELQIYEYFSTLIK